MNKELFGKYRLIEFIGKGGMAEVYRAVAESGPFVGRTLAIKRILPEFQDNSEYTDLFLAEADLTRMLSHHAIIPVLETGIINGRYYILMDFIKGMDLEKLIYWCQEFHITLPVDFCCFIAYTIAEALSYAHKAKSASGTPLNIVHCDVTPANIFISDMGEIFLGDFGVSQSIGLLQRDEHAVMGKASYMAPEQITGQSVLPATDIFALGTIFYQLLTGKAAFKGKNYNATWDAILAGKHTPADKLRCEISPEINRVLERAIAPNLPATGIHGWLRHHLTPWTTERYEDADEFINDLEPLFNHQVGEPLAIAAVVRGIQHTLVHQHSSEIKID